MLSKYYVSRIYRSFRTKKNFEEYLYDDERQTFEEYLGRRNIQMEIGHILNKV